MRFSLIAVLSSVCLPLVAAAAPSPPAADMDVTPIAARILQSHANGTRYGLLVTTLEGQVVASINADQRFIPASNTKMFTTITAFAALPQLDAAAEGTGVSISPVGRNVVDLTIHGRGDARLSSGEQCDEDCLQTLADAIAAKRITVRNITGDDSWLPDERWGPGMSWNNIQSRYGTAVSALTIDNNELSATVSAGRGAGSLANVDMSAYYRVDNRVVTVSGDGKSIIAERSPYSDIVRLTGYIGMKAAPDMIYLSLDDPARYAAWRMRVLLKARSVKVTGDIGATHRPLSPADDPAVRRGSPVAAPPPPVMIAQLPALPLGQDMTIINKQSQNLHAELMLRRVAHLYGSGSIADGHAALHKVMLTAGVQRQDYDFADGSGMSSYNRITPRAAVTLLRWAAQQSWGAAWRDTLPVGGQDGTLRRRFSGTILDGKMFAKTGSLNASRALSGYFIGQSGQTYVFSALANDMPDGTDAQATADVDSALIALAQAL